MYKSPRRQMVGLKIKNLAPEYSFAQMTLIIVTILICQPKHTQHIEEVTN